MFTGLIAASGKLARLQTAGTVWSLGVEAPELLQEGLRVGDSVAVNGICLTVVELRPPLFFAEAVAETRAKTTLVNWQVGAGLNLERALRLSDRLDGHLVAGHVDAVARVQNIFSEGPARRVRLQAPGELMRYIAAKGSVALDGISLTVAEVILPDAFEIAVIPHTLAQTTALTWAVGASVNLEVDLIARYLERLGNFSSPGALSLAQLRGAGF
jgi:riboflavin synthase